MLTKLGRKKGQLSPKNPHLATCTGVLARSVVNTSSRSTPDAPHTFQLDQTALRATLLLQLGEMLLHAYTYAAVPQRV